MKWPFLPKRKSAQTDEVNNHVHTVYSFSPYTPSQAVEKASEAGLQAVGIMDHDSIAGAKEMVKAGKKFGMAITCGFELRCSFADTALKGKKLNNPDSINIAYVALHGIPHQHFQKTADFLKPIQVARNKRNVRMVEKLNGILPKYGLEPIDFRREIYNRSCAAQGGSITERHILSAMARKIERKKGRGEPLVRFCISDLGLSLSSRIEQALLDRDNPHYHYDLLGVLKSSFLDQIYIQPGPDEVVPVIEFLRFGNSIHAIPVYAYLGDVAESPTGDKKAEKFEDAFLEELLAEIRRLGFKGVTYMPPRNTLEQLLRLQRLCKENGLLEISGVDINSSRQSFNCPILLEPAFRHLVTATWALIAHELLATLLDEKWAFFHPQNPYAAIPLEERTMKYAEIGKRTDPKRPERIGEVLKIMDSLERI